MTSRLLREDEGDDDDGTMSACFQHLFRHSSGISTRLVETVDGSGVVLPGKPGSPP